MLFFHLSLDGILMYILASDLVRRHCNAYLKSKICVVWWGILGFQMCIAMFHRTKSDDYLILYMNNSELQKRIQKITIIIN